MEKLSTDSYLLLIRRMGYSGIIYDTLRYDMLIDENFVLPKDIFPLSEYECNIFGPAFTAVGKKTTKPDLSMTYDLLDKIPSGSVYVLQANDNSVAHFGDITAEFLAGRKVEGAYIQGWVRDKKRIIESGFRVFAKGCQPQDSFTHWNIDTINEEIVIGNVFIKPLDYIFADCDGAIRIKKEWVPRLAEACYWRMKREDRIRDLVRKGVGPREIEEKEGRW